MDNGVVVPPTRRHRLRDDVLELLKLIVRLALAVAPTEIGRLVKSGVDYVWKRATKGRELRDKVAHLRIQAQTLLTRVEGVQVHPARAQQWALLAGDVKTFLAEYDEYVSWGGWTCFLRKNILKHAQDVAVDELGSLERRELAELAYVRDARDEQSAAEQRAHHASMVAWTDSHDAKLEAIMAHLARQSSSAPRGEMEVVPA